MAYDPSMTMHMRDHPTASTDGSRNTVLGAEILCLAPELGPNTVVSTVARIPAEKLPIGCDARFLNNLCDQNQVSMFKHNNIPQAISSAPIYDEATWYSPSAMYWTGPTSQIR